MALLFALALVAAWVNGSDVAAAAAAVTFDHDIAPVVFQNCSGCHRPGQPAPFSLLNYQDVRQHARQIVEVTEKRFMPPWLPETGPFPFQHERHLTPDQILLFRRWLEAGTPEGQSTDLPPLPHFVEGWQLGPPDVIANMSGKFTVPAAGYDVYRNFILPVGLTTRKYVRAVEFRPGPGGAVHHAFVRVDRRGGAQKLDGRDGQAGFSGMQLPEGVEMPGGYFLSWQPGKTPSSEAPGYGWTLEPGQALTVEAHLKPAGKPVDLQLEVGLYFTDIVPTNATVIFSLASLCLAIPPGETNYVVEDQFVLPIPVELMSVLPHAHYLGRRLEGFAVRPGGAPESLIRINDWDFNWQGDYRYGQPVRLPAGTLLRMRYTYDNSAANPRNPHSPPQEIDYGPQSADEMAELWFQVRADDAAAAAQLNEAYAEKRVQLISNYAQFRLRRNPQDADARTEWGFVQMRNQDQAGAMASFRAAIQDDPKADQPHYFLGVIYRTQNHLTEARAEFETAIRLNPQNAKAHGNLGIIFMEQGNLRRAERSLREALRLNPADDLARDSLEKVRQAMVSP